MKKLVPKYEWITYNEPERHLDSLSKVISKLPGINKNSRIVIENQRDDFLYNIDSIEIYKGNFNEIAILRKK